MSPRARRLVAAIVVLPALALGAVWTLENLGRVPSYNDTAQYLRLSRSLRVDQYRGVAYPALLAAIDRVHPGGALLTRRAPHVWWVQVAQIVLCGAALAYFAAVLLPFPRRARDGHGRPWPAFLASTLLVALVLLDPLVSHFDLSLMPDSLALSGSLVFCAAFADLLRRRSSLWVPGAWMLVAYLVLANTRAEKNIVLLATGITSVVLLRWLGQRGSTPLPGHRLLAAILVVLVGFGATLAVQRASFRPRGRMPTTEWILHHRVIYPHLWSVYDRLPAHLRRQIPPRQARRYVTNFNAPRKVMKTLGPRIRDRAAFTRELAAAVARERWPVIALDIAGDTCENVLASASFYFRLGVLAIGGEGTSRAWFRDGASRYTWAKLSETKPSLSLAYVLAAAGLLTAAVLASVRVVRRVAPREWTRRAPGILSGWVPAALFCLFNALAFALTGDLVHIRYTLFAHTVFLMLTLRGLAEWATPRGAERSDHE